MIICAFTLLPKLIRRPLTGWHYRRVLGSLPVPTSQSFGRARSTLVRELMTLPTHSRSQPRELTELPVYLLGFDAERAVTKDLIL